MDGVRSSQQPGVVGLANPDGNKAAGTTGKSPSGPVTAVETEKLMFEECHGSHGATGGSGRALSCSSISPSVETITGATNTIRLGPCKDSSPESSAVISQKVYQVIPYKPNEWRLIPDLEKVMNTVACKEHWKVTRTSDSITMPTSAEEISEVFSMHRFRNGDLCILGILDNQRVFFLEGKSVQIDDFDPSGIPGGLTGGGKTILSSNWTDLLKEMKYGELKTCSEHMKSETDRRALKGCTTEDSLRENFIMLFTAESPATQGNISTDADKDEFVSEIRQLLKDSDITKFSKEHPDNYRSELMSYCANNKHSDNVRLIRNWLIAEENSNPDIGMVFGDSSRFESVDQQKKFIGMLSYPKNLGS